MTATRTPQSIAAIPGSVTVITREELKQQSATMALPGLGDLLGKAVPGLGLGFGTGDSFGQNLRGRAAVVLIDGVPQDTQPASGREYLTIDPEAIERIEVIRGATAIYGNGAAGGVINIITRKPGADGMQGRTSLGTHASLTHPSGSLGGSFAQELSGRNALLDYVLQASLTSSSGQFDAQGDRSAPGSLNGSTGGLLDTRTRNFFGKLGKSFDRQRVQLTLNRFESQMDTDLAPDPAVDALCPDVRDPGCVRTKARYVNGISIDNKPHQDNTQISFDYDHAALWGSRLHVQVFHRELKDTRHAVRRAGLRRHGCRAGRRQFEEAWCPARSDHAVQPGRRARAAVGTGLSAREGRLPERDLRRGSVRRQRRARVPQGGRRHRHAHRTRPEGAVRAGRVASGGVAAAARRHAPRDIVAKLPEQTAFGTPIRSGSRHFRDTVYNAGAVFYPSEALDVFVNYAQGFTAPRLDVLVFSIPVDGSLSALRPESNVVDNYEVGLRWQRDAVQAALSLFYAKSSLGAGYNQFTNRTVESPERTHGFEATLDVEATLYRARRRHVELRGRQDQNRCGHLGAAERFSHRAAESNAASGAPHRAEPAVAQPPATGVLRLARSVVQGLRSRRRSERDPFPTRSFAVVDLYSSLNLGGGWLEAGIENLFNKQYELPTQQIAFANTFRYPSSGARLSVKYALSY